MLGVLNCNKPFELKKPNANHLTVNIYSNCYLYGQIRQVKLLIKSGDVLYTRQKNNGLFETDNFWKNTDGKLIRQKNGKRSA